MNTEPGMVAVARRLRHTMTPPEVRLWVRLRSVRPQFRRQHPLGCLVLDFYCHAARLAIEFDGCAHSMGDIPARDGRRDAAIRAIGLEVVRNAASDVMADPEAIAEWLRTIAAARALSSPE